MMINELKYSKIKKKKINRKVPARKKNIKNNKKHVCTS